MSTPIEDLASGLKRDDAVRGRQAALEPVLAEQDRHTPLLVEAAKKRDQLVAGDGVELRGRLVEQEERRAGDQGRSEGDALQLAPRERVGGALEQRLDAERQGRLLNRAGGLDRARAAQLHRQLELGADGG